MECGQCGNVGRLAPKKSSLGKQTLSSLTCQLDTENQQRNSRGRTITYKALGFLDVHMEQGHLTDTSCGRTRKKLLLC